MEAMDRRLSLVFTLLIAVWLWGNPHSTQTVIAASDVTPQDPTQPTYTKLQQALEWYRRIAAAGGWGTISNGPTLSPGDYSERVVALRARLQVTDDLAPMHLAIPLDDAPHAHTSLYFDANLEQSVRAFQRRHGLQVDGIVGPETLAALNLSVDMRIAQIALNLERWRQDAEELGERYILVNIPAFSLEVVNHDHTALSMRVIVGKLDHRTPIFHAFMTYLVLNPYWEVPPNIARREILPAIYKDPSYLEKHNMQVMDGWGSEAQVIEAAAIDWSEQAPLTLQYRFRQAPGEQNTLGRVKFKFPNSFNVYLHDTVAPSLFAKTQRAFSHGCIRVEQPIELATYLLQDQPEWSRERILATIAQDAERKIDLLTPIPVHIVYRTAWVDAAGVVQFRPDLYGYDKVQEASLCSDSARLCG
jgi:murein L,D-transpeptidase YcbB/YkuD